MKLQQSTLAALLITAGAAAHAAGGHYVVDDATITDAGRCQLEAWYSYGDSGNSEFTLLPACNPWGNLELGVGLIRLQQDGEYASILELEARTLIRTLEPGGWGWGLALATTHGAVFERFEGLAAYAPLSVHVTDTLITHLNLGGAHESGGDDSVIWGIGGELSVSPALDLIAEIQGTHRGGTEVQAGLRYHTGPVALDLSYGFTRANTGDDWFTLGLAWGF